MRWQGRQGSGNIEDRRGSGGSRMGGTVGKAGLGIGGVIMVIIIMLLGGDPSAILGGASTSPQSQNRVESTTTSNEQPTDQMGKFASVVLKDTEDVWNKIFAEEFNADYPEPKLVLFSGATSTACGMGQSATGPFYCPADQDIYIDLTFFNELQNRFGAGGDFAAAYVIAHEVGHHIQKKLGASDYVNQQRGRVSKAKQNELSVRLELQADFYAGVWAHYADKWKDVLEEGDIEEALNAANAIGDDRLQKQAQGYAVPETFTHGTSAQRKRWFLKGYQTGDIRQGDTFKTNDL
ncbi:neutral zinc metallopeptidase [Bernardetia sp.]|uniref:KPN_02809 family neutral zinc metallopeptidase n=1 Tax=Bernardetia sp. TaxID=1937974 RepID=UPI0025B7F50F|nr:neutral zinc metallopeptidase [Bernardetia sp.]